jgi:hypothetical protein
MAAMAIIERTGPAGETPALHNQPARKASGDALRQRIAELLAQRPDLSQRALAAAMANIAPKTFLCWLHRTNADTEETLTEVERVIGCIERGELLRPGGDALTEADYAAKPRRVRSAERGVRNYYELATPRAIWDVLDYALEHESIGLVIANYGVGKTEAVARWMAKHRDEAVSIEVISLMGGHRVEFLRAIAEASALPNSGSALALFKRIVAELRATPRLIVLDQAESLTPRVFAVVRELWDAVRLAGSNFAVLAAPDLWLRMHGSRSQQLGAIRSRTWPTAVLSGFTREEMAYVVRQEGISEVDDEAFTLWHKAAGGSMRTLLASIDLIRTKHAGRKVTEKTIAGVAGFLWGMKGR